jgi:hypothetical protein
MSRVLSVKVNALGVPHSVRWRRVRNECFITWGVERLDWGGEQEEQSRGKAEPRRGSGRGPCPAETKASIVCGTERMRLLSGYA